MRAGLGARTVVVIDPELAAAPEHLSPTAALA